MPKHSPNRVTETEVAEAALAVLADRPNGEASIEILVRDIPKHLNLSADDCAPSTTRPGEQMWEQQVRNITSHHEAPGNFIREGYLQRIKGGLKITDAGRARLAR